MFTDVLYRHLQKRYSKDFYVNPEYCIAIDLFNGREVRYSEVADGDIPLLLDATIDNMNKL